MRPVLAATLLASVIAVAAFGPVAACKSAPPPVLAPPPPSAPTTAPTGDTTSLADDLRATVLESYRALSGGYDEAYLDGIAHDRSLILIDVGPDAVVIGFDPIACKLRKEFPERRIELVSKALEVHISADHTVGWTYDELSYRVWFGARRVFVPLRATTVYERRDQRWVLVAQHVSYGVSDEDALLAAATGRLVAGKPIGEGDSPGAAAQGARRVVLGLIADEDDTRTRGVATDDGALLLGSDPGREIRGAKIAETSTPRALFGYDYHVTSRGLRVVSSSSTTVAWAAADLTITGERDGKPLALPVRATWVLEKQGGAWKVVQTHVSVSVSRAELEHAIFGGPASETPGTD